MFLDKLNINIKGINVKDFVIIAVTVLGLDFIAFKLYITQHFSKLIKSIQNSEMTINFFGAALAYFFITLTIYVFVIQPKLSYFHAGLLGFLIYGIYETTNLALFKKWTLLTVLIDSVWGGILFFLTTFVFYNYKKLTSS